ncbi:flippase-like domain-containing protein [Microaerobacter geothermalis]|uniref:lysylphosphatidylglycerol synthase transmembrane domain-containing protein n=1 Tax=Microaerobacter geothermalis TaxID=674972 RepID=UPI001F3C362B|nr:lysylphosphatidylglycerol synthase transmembrane domain-containing protein [Microaerobacter geothermalis]MCF6095136.1 flippase-like domain-containing protein [Microaerobacter geothermalis]
MFIHKKWLWRGIGLFLLIWSVYIIYVNFSVEQWQSLWKGVFQHPALLVFLFIPYTISFMLRGLGWQVLLKNRVSNRKLLKIIYVTLLFNHLLPFKGGDLIRIYLVRSHGVSWKEGAWSVLLSRILDIISLLFLIVFLFWPIPGMIVGTLLIIFFNIFKGRNQYTRSFLYIFPSWVMEGVILWSVAQILMPVSFPTAAMVNSITILGQTFSVTPGGLGTYEGIMSYFLFKQGIPLETGIQIAIFTHAFKFVYSYLFGLPALLMMKEGIGFLWKEAKKRQELEKS